MNTKLQEIDRIYDEAVAASTAIYRRAHAINLVSTLGGIALIVLVSPWFFFPMVAGQVGSCVYQRWAYARKNKRTDAQYAALRERS